VSDETPGGAEKSGKGWWGSFSLEEGRAGCWSIDTLQLWILRSAREWQIARQTGCTTGGDGGWSVDLDATMPDDSGDLERHVFTRTHNGLKIWPGLADRPVVASPRIPLFVAPGEKTTLYVGSPLWVRVEVESPSRVILDVPVRRPSDTWFGPSTREGEMCYATRTRAILDVANLPSLAGRAITPVAIENQGAETLRVERLKLPVPYLSVHGAADGQLWTPTVTMIGQQESGMASFDVGRRPPASVSARQVSSAREQSSPGLLIRAFSLFRTAHDHD
jgi:hypothetical protein